MDDEKWMDEYAAHFPEQLEPPETPEPLRYRLLNRACRWLLSLDCVSYTRRTVNKEFDPTIAEDIDIRLGGWTICLREFFGDITLKIDHWRRPHVDLFYRLPGWAGYIFQVGWEMLPDYSDDPMGSPSQYE